MSLVLLGITCLPCDDSGFARAQSKAQTEIDKHDDQRSGQEHNDNCPPFCHCTCCASFSLNHLVTEIVPINPCHTTNYTSQYTGSVIEISLPVWQPPQLT